MNQLIKHLKFQIQMQNEIKEETGDLFPQWNKGYLEALEDILKHISLPTNHIPYCGDFYEHV